MNIKTKFGRNIKKLRKERKLTQEELAEIANMDRSYLSDIERGIKSISIEKIENLAIALKMEISELFDFNKKI